MNKKRLGFFLLAGLLLASALVFLPAVKDGAQADTTANGFIQGWLWSSNVGWLNADQSRVSIADDGKVNGYVWSPSLGWLRLNPATTSVDTYPSAPNSGVQVDSGKTSMSGWARFCNVYQDPNKCSGTSKVINGTELGGWDGWVKLVNVAKGDDGKLSGYAWGNYNLGWMTFGSGVGSSGCTPGSSDRVDISCPGDSVSPRWCDPSCGPCIKDCGGGPTTKLSCSVSPTSGDLSTSFRWEADYKGSESPVTYTWSGSESLNGKVGKIVTINDYESPGTKTGEVTAESGGTPLGSVPCSGSVNVTDCAVPGEAPSAGKPCCAANPTVCNIVGDPNEGKCGACVGGCTLTLGASPNDHIVFSNDADFPALSQVNARVSLSASCFTAGNVSFTGEGLPDKATLVCSGSRSGPYSVAGCGDLSLSDVWVGMSFEGHPSTFPSIGTVPPKVFTISAGSASVGTYLLYLNPVE